MVIKKRINNENQVTFEDAEKLADELADRSYGVKKIIKNKPDERITIKIPYDLYEYLDDLSRERKRAKMQNKTQVQSFNTSVFHISTIIAIVM